jgi:hypothetical protein
MSILVLPGFLTAFVYVDDLEIERTLFNFFLFFFVVYVYGKIQFNKAQSGRNTLTVALIFAISRLAV